MTISLYRKYRPQNFASVVGQKAAVDVLTKAITKGRVGHAYLFSGSRGCGKTSIARIFAKALNCLDPQGYEPCGKCANCEAITAGESLDVIEIDGASNNGVENIRGLRENITLAPFSSAHKIYIIDEVHMLSQGAFNALLKTIEEPPEHAIFIMATTEPHKVPVTIRSRCQHIPFHSISPEDIYSRLEYVCRAEGMKSENEALWEISRQAEGALRDALSLLEQVAASGEITLANVESVLGTGSRPAFERWLKTLRTGTQEAYTALKAMTEAGASGVRVFEEMFSLVRDLWLVSKWKGIADSLGLSSSEKEFLLEEVNNWTPENLHILLNNILQALTKARQGMRPDILLGMFLLSLEAAPPEPAPQMTKQQIPEVISAREEYRLETSSGDDEDVPDAFDPVLREEMQKIAHDVNFVIYCALFDTEVYISDGLLIVEVAHAYCYDRLALPANAAQLAMMFKKYGRVILNYDDYTTKCTASEDLLEKFRTPPAPGTQAVKPQAESDFYEPEEADIPEAPAAPAAQAEPEAAAFRREVSAFKEYRRELSLSGANPEVILRRRKEEPESEDRDNDLQEEGDSEE